jgi:dTMP kinase
MRRNKYQGLFIAVEGLDGSGLSTQANLLKDHFRQNGTETYLTKEPTDNVIGGLIRGVLSGVYKLQPEAMQLLFSADRSHHLNREVIPMLKKKSVVVCDRYLWSTVAFGSTQLDKKWLLEINKHAVVPDITIILKVPPKVCIKRLAKDRFNFELYEKLNELKKVWSIYQWLANKFDKDIVVVDGEGKIEEIHGKVIDTVLKNSKAKKMIRGRSN